MIRALYAGVSGLLTHTVKLDVIGNNIANVNTYGYKGSRVTFAESLSQQVGSALAPGENHGGVNPMLVGLGSKVSSIDNNFTQGNLLSTGITTDLGIQGDGFFVISDGSRNYYSRSGAFQIDAEGNLVAQGGAYYVKGKMADADGNISTGSGISNITLPFGQKEPAKATTEIDYYCNLNSDADAKTNVWSANDSFTTNATVSGGSAPTFPMTIDASNDEFQISLNGADPVTATIAQGTINDIDALVSAINDGINATNLTGTVYAVKYFDPALNEEVVKFKTQASGSEVSLTLNDAGDSLLSQLGITNGASGTGVADENTLLNDLAEVSSDLVAGDSISISGLNPSGTTVSGTFTYADGDTVGDLVQTINDTYTGTTATINGDGKLTLTDNIPGSSDTTISLSTYQNVGTIALPTFSNTVVGTDYGTHSTSIDVYDSLGEAHTVEMIFTKAPTENTWDWEVKVDNGLLTPTSGYSGTVNFNSDGSLANFSGGPLVFTPPGASAMSIDLNPGTSGTFDGITQFNSQSTTIALNQNGYSMGELDNISIEPDGIISGTFSNGVIRTLGQIAIADFNNPAGLIKAGNNLFEESANSGNAVVGMAQTNFNSSINSGYLEMSNVDLTREFTELIVAQRGFQANARVIQTSDMVLAEINGLKR